MSLIKAIGAITGKLLGLALFLMILWLLNLFTIIFQNPTFLAIVDFLNANKALIISAGILFIVAELFHYLWFPFNIPYPIFNAFGAVLIAGIVFQVFRLANIIMNNNPFDPLLGLAQMTYVIIFWVVLISGYVHLIARYGAEGSAKRQRKERSAKEGSLGEEFRQTISDILAAIRRAVRGK